MSAPDNDADAEFERANRAGLAVAGVAMGTVSVAAGLLWWVILGLMVAGVVGYLVGAVVQITIEERRRSRRKVR